MRLHGEWKHRAAATQRTVVAIGNFDGVHRGHQALLAAARKVAAAARATPVAMTFDPHPKSLFCPDAAPPRLSSVAAKVDQIARCGIDGVWVQTFDRAFAAVSAEDFVEQVLQAGLGMVHVVVGEDYRFGERRRGDVGLLRRLGARNGFGVTVVEPLRDGGAVISSTRVRAALGEGRIGEANALLGRPWEIEGRLVRNGGAAMLPLGDYQHPGRGVVDALVSPDYGPRTSWMAARLARAGDESARVLSVSMPAGAFADASIRVRLMGTIPDA